MLVEGKSDRANDELLISPRHVPCAVYESLVNRQELIEIFDTLGIFIEKLGFSRLRFAMLDEV
jgi:hypothetical protein